MEYLYKLFLALFALLPQRDLDPLVHKEVDDVYDFIVVGSGPGGATVASRLSEIPNIKVLLLEAGESDLKDPRIKIPTRAYDLEQTDIDWKYETEPITHPPQSERIMQMPRGKVLGGTSSINYNVYARGSPHDYDSWEDHGAVGWSWNDVEPYFRKVENATMKGLPSKLGRDGYLKLSRNHNAPNKAWNLFTRAANEVGIKTTDYNDDIEGISHMTFTIHDGIRQNSVTAYIRPIYEERKKNLHVVTGALVSKILIDNNSQSTPSAYGVEYLKNGKRNTVRARKEVIISAGVIGTPQLLLLSGIGPKEDLKILEIPVISDLRGVGKNLQEHWALRTYFTTNVTNPAPVNNPLMQYIFNGTGPMSMFPYATIFTKSPMTSASTERRPFPDLQLYLFELPLPGFGFFPTLLHPKSRGTIKLKSKNIKDHPAINTNYLENEDDVRTFIEAFRLIEQFERSSAFKEAGAQMRMPSVCNGSSYQNIPRSDKLYRCLILETGGPGNHQCCTAKMGSRTDEYAVVDPRLRVNGVRGLRIADSSVLPHQTSSNLQASIYMIGEKISDMIKEDWQYS